VMELRKGDEDHKLDVFEMNDWLLYRELVKVIRSIGFQMQHGRVVGLLSHDDTATDDQPFEPGTPDVE
jgi:hypothetical protein